MISALITKIWSRTVNRIKFSFILWQVGRDKKLVDRGREIENDIDLEINFLIVSAQSLELAEAAGRAPEKRVTPEMIEARIVKLQGYKEQLAISQEKCLRDLNEKLQLLSDLTQEAAKTEATR